MSASPSFKYSEVGDTPPNLVTAYPVLEGSFVASVIVAEGNSIRFP